MISISSQGQNLFVPVNDAPAGAGPAQRQERVGGGALHASGGAMPDPIGGGNTPRASFMMTQSYEGGTGGTDVSMGNLKAASRKLDDGDFKTALAGLISLVSTASSIGALLIEMASMQRQNALDSRLAARDAARSDMQSQADSTRDSASKAMAAAITGLVTSVISAGIQFASAALQFKAADGALKNLRADAAGGQGASGMSEQMSIAINTQSTSRASAQGDMLNALNGLMKGLGDATSGLLQAESKMIDADGQEFAAKAEMNKAEADTVQKFMDELQQMIDATMKFLSDLAQAEADMMATASRL